MYFVGCGFLRPRPVADFAAATNDAGARTQAPTAAGLGSDETRCRERKVRRGERPPEHSGSAQVVLCAVAGAAPWALSARRVPCPRIVMLDGGMEAIVRPQDAELSP